MSHHKGPLVLKLICVFCVHLRLNFFFKAEYRH